MRAEADARSHNGGTCTATTHRANRMGALQLLSTALYRRDDQTAYAVKQHLLSNAGSPSMVSCAALSYAR